MAVSDATVHTINQLAQAAFLHKKKNKKLVFVSGYFRVLHPGHIRLLRFAKEIGDELIVGVFQSNKVSPSTTQEQVDKKTQDEEIADDVRLQMLSGIDWVDHAFLMEPEALEKTVEILQPDCVVKGKEHELGDNPEESVLAQYGGKLVFGSGITSYSSSDLGYSDNACSAFHCDKELIRQTQDYADRHNFDFSSLNSTLSSFSNLKVCVIGDCIVDEYIQCEALGMSQEDPTLVVRPMNRERFIGGAAIVASHMKALGAGSVSLCSVLGNDESAEFVRQTCSENGVDHYFINDDTRPTSLKQRFRSQSKTLLRVSNLRQHHINRNIQTQFCEYLEKKISHANLLVFSDFSYGMLPQSLVNKVSALCKQHHVMMVADSQSSSQLGDVSRFKGMGFITPTEHEARIALNNNDDGLVVLAEKLRKKSKADHVMITLAEEGVLIQSSMQSSKEGFEGGATDRLPAFNRLAKDCAGAGDCFMAVSALAMAAGTDIWASAYLGSIAAACQVGQLGNLPLDLSLLERELRS